MSYHVQNKTMIVRNQPYTKGEVQLETKTLKEFKCDHQNVTYILTYHAVIFTQSYLFIHIKGLKYEVLGFSLQMEQPTQPELWLQVFVLLKQQYFNSTAINVVSTFSVTKIQIQHYSFIYGVAE